MEGWDGEDYSLGRTGPNSSEHPFPKVTKAKLTGGMAQMVECQLYKHIAWIQTPNPPINKQILRSKVGFQNHIHLRFIRFMIYFDVCS
jgi:hypothetical protein